MIIVVCKMILILKSGRRVCRTTGSRALAYTSHVVFVAIKILYCFFKTDKINLP